ncbi:lytic polysaccharide monooxygenase [Streptomyces sp. NPDC058001]|uniref:lytic polysaccharide monooxygenase n=1 Tax=Streptomyces sp. NPDC058001 TaxID=3346300 RepID=UPI0036E5EF65
MTAHPSTHRTAHRPAHRTAAAGLALAGAAVPLLCLLSAAGPAAAHGAPTDPVSRTVACSTEGGAAARSAACRAAVAAGGNAFADWDNLRVADVGGRDRQAVPDGRLCGGGLDAFRGLDLARADWPSTRLAPGAALTFTYRSTIAHTGTFELYLTRNGYDPTRPLTWSDLTSKPFATAVDPPLVNGAYRIRAKLPSDRTGRQVLYTIWRNSSTPDTYYSCSDVVFPTAPKATGAAEATRTAEVPGATGATRTAEKPSAVTTAEPSTGATPESSTGTTAQAIPDSPLPATAAGSDADSGPGLPLPLIAAGLAALGLTTGAAVLIRRRR